MGISTTFFLRLCVGQGCPTRGPHAAREVVLSGPLCNKFVSRLFKFLVFFYRLKYIYHQTTPKLYLLFLLWTYHPKTCTTNASKICQLFRFGLHPFKPATLRATIGLIITSCYRIKLIKIERFVTSHSLIVTSQKTFVARNKFPHVKVGAALKRLCRRGVGFCTFLNRLPWNKLVPLKSTSKS